MQVTALSSQVTKDGYSMRMLTDGIIFVGEILHGNTPTTILYFETLESLTGCLQTLAQQKHKYQPPFVL